VLHQSNLATAVRDHGLTKLITSREGNLIMVSVALGHDRHIARLADIKENGGERS
jgi:hypothetical protein